MLYIILETRVITPAFLLPNWRNLDFELSKSYCHHETLELNVRSECVPRVDYDSFNFKSLYLVNYKVRKGLESCIGFEINSWRN